MNFSGRDRQSGAAGGAAAASTVGLSDDDAFGAIPAAVRPGNDHVLPREFL